jgi:hypothetical protein
MAVKQEGHKLQYWYDYETVNRFWKWPFFVIPQLSEVQPEINTLGACIAAEGEYVCFE